MKYFHWVLKPPIFVGDAEKTRRAEILHYVSLLLFVFSLILFEFNLLVGSEAEKSANWILGLIAAIQIMVQWMIRSEYVNEASLLLLTIGWWAMTEISRDVSGVRDVAIIGYVLILLGSGYLLGWRIAIAYTLVSIAAIWWLAYTEAQGFFVPSLGNPYRIALDITVVFVLIFFVIYFLVKTLTTSLDNAQRELDERLRVEQALEIEQERLHLALDAARMGTWSLDVETGTVSWSTDVARMFGVEPGQLVNSQFDNLYEIYLSLIHPDDLPKVLDTHKRALSGDLTDYIAVHRLIWPNGEIRWLENRGKVYRDDNDGRPLRMAGTVVDVTKQKQAEAEREKLIRELEIKNAEAETLRESTTIVAAALEVSETVQRILEQLKKVVTYDSASVWIVEDNVARIIGGTGLHPDVAIPGMEYTINEQEPDYPLLTQDIPYILYDDIQAHFPQFKDPVSAYIRGWMAIPLRSRRKFIGSIFLDGRKVGQFTEADAQKAVTYAKQVAIALENARLFSELQNELTTRKELISELESKNAELEQFTYTVSHDLKAPLITINGFLGYLEEDIAAGDLDRVNHDSQRIQEAVGRMRLLLDQLLELSRIGRMMNPPEEISFEELAREALGNVQGRLEERNITIRLSPNMPTVYGDHQRLVEVLQNLIDNAAKFMGEQSKPEIEIGQQGKENGLPVFYVKDNGIGIDPKHHELVFALFQRLDPTTDGTGIGLALVKRIVEYHGGRIWVESDAGTGSTFYFTLSRPQPSL